MIKVYVNGEWYCTFQTQEQYDNWVQRTNFFELGWVEVEYIKGEQ